jgi:hypothetical protein
MAHTHPNPDWLQREDVLRLVKEARAIIVKDPESLTDSPSPVADVVCNVMRGTGGYEKRLARLREIINENVADENLRDIAIGIVTDFDEDKESWLTGEVVEGVLADRISRLALAEVGLHVVSSQRGGKRS